ncbi:MAG: DUF4827 domain-containing protein [Candidatus Azobacteroides sp.]|nr:DUF4827 domain-containing protein [Candidatus Azobacteroides sp.]
MRKILIFIFSLVVIPALWLACKNSKTYAELLKDEQNAISKLIADSGFVVLNYRDYPKDRLFEPNEFVKLPNGLYLNVIDSGNGERIDSFSTVLLRYRSSRNLFDTLSVPGNWNSLSPMEFTYGLTASSTSGYVEGIATPLSYVGNYAKVKLIIPSSLNSYSIMQSVVPYYYYCVKYQKY